MPAKTSNRTKTLTIRVGPATRAAIDSYAKARDMTSGEFVRYCVRVYMDTTFMDDADEELAQEDAERARADNEFDERTGGRKLEAVNIRRG